MTGSEYMAWSKRKRITTNPDIAYAPYQFMLWLTHDSVDDDYYNRLISLPEANTDFSDIRVVLEDSTPVNFAVVRSMGRYQLWIKIPNGSPYTYDIYYGNENASSLSNPSATFPFYDGFSSGISVNWTHSLTDQYHLSDGNPQVIDNQLVVEGKQNAGYVEHSDYQYPAVKVEEYTDTDYFQITIPQSTFLSSLPYTILISYEINDQFFQLPRQGISFSISDLSSEKLKFSFNNHHYSLGSVYTHQFNPARDLTSSGGPTTGEHVEVYLTNNISGGGFAVKSYYNESFPESHWANASNLTMNTIRMGYGLYAFGYLFSHPIKINHVIGLQYEISNLKYRWLSDISGPYDPDPYLYFDMVPSPATTIDQISFFIKSEYLAGYDEYAWEFGDGCVGYGPVVSHQYETLGVYSVTLHGASSRGFPQYSHTQQIIVTEGGESDLSGVPSASFTAKTIRGTGPLAVQFINTYTDADSYLWDFGDGEISTEQNPEHTYDYAQAYTVRLTIVKDTTTLTEVKKNFIQVTSTDPPVAGFTHDLTNNSGSIPVAVDFTDTSTGTITESEWDFGDGVTSSETNPTHVYANPGYYLVRRIVRNDEWEDILTELFYIRQRSPTIRIHATVVSGPAPLTVVFTPVIIGPYIRFQWSFGDGDTSIENNPEHIYSAPGTYTVTLTVWNTSTLYSTSGTITITVIDPALLPAAEFSADVTSGEAPVTVTFTDASTGAPTSWFWDFGDGTTSTSQNPSHTYSPPGSYSVSLTVTNTYGSNTETKTDYIDIGADPVSVPQVDADVHHLSHQFIFSSESENEPTSYLWDFGDGTTSTYATAGHIFTEVKSYWVTLTVTNTYGSHTIGIDVMVVPNTYPIPIFTWFTSNKKAPYTMQFSDASVGTPTSWLWDFGDGTTSTEQSPEHIYHYPGTYTVSLTVSNAYGTVSTTEEVLDAID